MPAGNIHFDKGVFFCRVWGGVDAEDALMWVDYAHTFAGNSLYPIVALVDASRVTGMTPKAHRVFAHCGAIPNFHMLLVVTGAMNERQKSRLISPLVLNRHSATFDTLAEAWTFAERRVDALRLAGARA